MSVFDVREGSAESITKIVFADEESYENRAAYIQKDNGCVIGIYDDQDDYVLIRDKQHALDLIKALNKAIELEWVK